MNGITVTAPCDTRQTTVTWIEPSATDNSGTATLQSRSHSPGQMFNVGTTQVTYQFVDPSGNVATYTFPVIVTEGKESQNVQVLSVMHYEKVWF